MSAFLPRREAPIRPGPRPGEEAPTQYDPPPRTVLPASASSLAAAALASLIAVTCGPAGAGHGSAASAASTAGPSGASPPAVRAMRGTGRYCAGYERTFHGAWTSGGGLGAPVPFRVGAAAEGRGCYAQLDLMAPPGVAPFELPRFRAGVKDRVWTLRYRTIVVTLDPGRGTAAYRQGNDPPFTGVLLARPPPVRDARAAPSAPAMWRERWYGRWRGRFAGVPFPVTLRLSPSDPDPTEVRGRASAAFFGRTFIGRFHGRTLIFRWRNRHVGLTMEPGGDALVHVDYRGRVYRFRRR